MLLSGFRRNQAPVLVVDMVSLHYMFAFAFLTIKVSTIQHD